MKIDITDLLKLKTRLINLNFNQDKQLYQAYIGQEGIILDNDICFIGTLSNNEGMLVLEGKLRFSYKIKCDRCLKQQTDTKVINIKVPLANDSYDDVNCVYFYSGNYVEINDIIKDEILLNIPLKFLCTQNCQGICPDCGMNMDTCKCMSSNKNIDPRLRALEEFKMRLNNSDDKNGRS